MCDSISGSQYTELSISKSLRSCPYFFKVSLVKKVCILETCSSTTSHAAGCRDRLIREATSGFSKRHIGRLCRERFRGVVWSRWLLWNRLELKRIIPAAGSWYISCYCKLYSAKSRQTGEKSRRWSTWKADEVEL